MTKTYEEINAPLLAATSSSRSIHGVDWVRNPRFLVAWCSSHYDFRAHIRSYGLIDQKWLPRFGWTTLEEERLNAVLPHVHGRLLDIGAGPNTLVKRYGNGIGVDVHTGVVVHSLSRTLLTFLSRTASLTHYLHCVLESYSVSRDGAT